jgi:hypothetical protein
MNRTLLLACATNLLICTGVARADVDVVLDWNAVMERTVAGQNPFAQARFAAITQLAVFEAVNTVTGDFEPYLGTIEAPNGASAEAAAIAAAYRVLKTYFPADAALDTARANSLAAISDSQAKADGIAVGEAAAVAMIALRSADGSAPPQFYAPSSSAAGEWQVTGGCPSAGGILLHWRNVAPFGIESSSQFRSDPPPALTSNEYVKDYQEVMAVGDAASVMRPADRADGARFYAAVLAVATWNPAVRQVAAAEGTSLSENARAFALLNVAISDALVSVMETKYHYTFWRPETAIPGFVPFIATPCFPGYPSAHASASYAAEEIARRIFGAGGHSIVLTSPPAVGVTLTYNSFKEIARDIDDARVYGGIHFRFDQEAGAVQGRDIGKYVYKNMLRPVQP